MTEFSQKFSDFIFLNILFVPEKWNVGTVYFETDCFKSKKKKSFFIKKNDFPSKKKGNIKILVIDFMFTLYTYIVIHKISQHNGKVNDDVLEIKIDDYYIEWTTLCIYKPVCGFVYTTV